MSSEPKIEKGVPITSRRRSNGAWAWLQKMEPGDSAFLATPEGVGTKQWASRVATSAANYGGRVGSRSYSIRRATESGVDGVRIWRIK